MDGVALGRPWGDLGLGKAFCILKHCQNEKKKKRVFRVEVVDLGVTIAYYLQHFSVAAEPAPTRATTHPDSKTIRQNPSSVNTVWGKTIDLHMQGLR